MDIEQQARHYWKWALYWWYGLSPQTVEYFWYGGALAWVLLSMFFAYRVYRKVAGHRKHRGTWYTQEQYSELMQILAEHSQTRVLQHEDMVALRAWKYGDTVKPMFGDQKWGGYS